MNKLYDDKTEYTRGIRIIVSKEDYLRRNPSKVVKKLNSKFLTNEYEIKETVFNNAVINCDTEPSVFSEKKVAEDFISDCIEILHFGIISSPKIDTIKWLLRTALKNDISFSEFSDLLWNKEK